MTGDSSSDPSPKTSNLNQVSVEEKNTSNKKNGLSTSQKDFIAGTVGGCGQVVAGHPFDTLKVRLQTQGPDARFKGAMDCFGQTIKKEGFFGLFKGMSSPLAGVAAVNAVLFTSYGQASEYLLGRRHRENARLSAQGTDDSQLNVSNELTVNESIIAGSFAGFVNCFVICPVELIKARLQVQYESRSAYKSGSSNLYRGPMDVIRRMGAESPYGYFGPFKGMMATIYREVPAYAAYFGAYEAFKYIFAYWRFKRFNPNTPLFNASKESIDAHRNQLNALELFVAGGMGGVGCWLASYPQDLIKSRLQIEPDNVKSKYRRQFFDGGFFDCGRQIWKQEGWRGYWRGFTPTIVRAFWANAATFLAYEMSMKMLNRYSE
eukprot:gb/GECH01001958.1/.p1 GENE.gb/GECH01001958.1/~~gb/GECH01001958.1/.p1  ORF type:complete len:376 (+),score=79.15 gb/GECH01001958.1/:1-1128(+)